MPLVRIEIPSSHADRKAAIGNAVQKALHDTLGVPLEEHFQVISDHGTGLVIDPAYLGVHRSPSTIIVQVFLNKGRDAAKKQSFYRAAVEELQVRTGLAPADVVISLVEVSPEDWSFGNGEAQLVK